MLEAFLEGLNVFFCVVFFLEFCLKIIGWGVYSYLRNPWNCLDFFIVVVSEKQLSYLDEFQKKALFENCLNLLNQHLHNFLFLKNTFIIINPIFFIWVVCHVSKYWVVCHVSKYRSIKTLYRIAKVSTEHTFPWQFKQENFWHKWSYLQPSSGISLAKNFISLYGEQNRFVRLGRSVWKFSYWRSTYLSQVSIAAVISNYTSSKGNLSAFRSIRTLRALRPLRAISRWEGIRVFIDYTYLFIRN